ncbi:hypothetical protein [Nitratireductor alexandrii]|uniref:hypothetical protein n=1 Tax=Nitratireductor alexandrii TaxID=2448161 RepID=UPI000FD7571C|nr:hypothetical protein [Nitratireductor alexandrii]
MSTADFRRIADRDQAGKAERLLRAAVSAFASLTRPSRREIRQLDQLAAPLFDKVPAETLRYVAAVLSESPHTPPGLLARLCEQSADIAAPLLIRSPLLGDAALLGLIARHGLTHARVIKRRPRVHPTIIQVAKLLEATAARPPEQAAPTPTPASRGLAELARRRLLQTMSDNENAACEGLSAKAADDATHDGDHFRKLRAAALAENREPFFRALAETVCLPYDTARMIARARTYDDLLVALRSLDLTEEQAFLLACAASPWRFPQRRNIRLFLEKFRSISRDAARAQVETSWRESADRSEKSTLASGRDEATALRA